MASTVQAEQVRSDYALRQHDNEPPRCAEEGCVRPAYDRSRCKLHADVAAHRETRPAVTQSSR
jgi:hypothetical protein